MIKKALIILCLTFLGITTKVEAQQFATAKKVVKLMGCRFEITAVATNKQTAWQAVELGIAEISRIERLISSWDSNSQTSKINQYAGIKPVQVDSELFDLIYRAQKVAELTDGAFDISFASMDRIWTFDGKEQVLKDSALVLNAAKKINWENILLDQENHSVFLKEKGMKIGFGAIGKGYAANMAKKKMIQLDAVKGGVVNASGDLFAWGINAKSDQWTIQLANPTNKEKSLGWLQLNNTAMVTSGDYEKFFTCKGKRYAHIINPKTGYPTTGIKSVSVICPDAELADALATSVFVLGKDKGLTLINQLNMVECIIITDDDQVHTSNSLNLNYY